MTILLLLAIVFFILNILTQTIEYSLSILSKEEKKILNSTTSSHNINVKLYNSKPTFFLSTIILLKIISFVCFLLNIFFIYFLLFCNFEILNIIIFITTSLILVMFSNYILPILIVGNNPKKYFVKISPLIRISSLIFYPFVWIIEQSSFYIKKRTSSHPTNYIEEITDAIENRRNEEENSESKILKSIVNFSDIAVKEIMKSRLDVVAVDYDFNFNKLYQIILDAGYSRMPVYKKSFDNIVGVLYIKDLLPFLDNKNLDVDWHSLIRSPIFVPESKKIIDLLRELQEKKVHLAIVVDEYGGTSGIVTLEDIMEEVVGDINDEFDSEEVIYSKINEKNYYFEAKTSINDFCKITNTETDYFDDVKGESDSLAGLILEHSGKIPENNETIKIKRFLFKVVASDKRRIKKIKITIEDEE